MKDEILNYVGMGKIKQYNSDQLFDLNQDEISEKEKIELEMIEGKMRRITMLYELNKKIKFSDKCMDNIAKYIDKHDKEHNMIINIAVGLTILSPFI